MAVPLNTPFVGIQTSSIQTVLALTAGSGVTLTTDLAGQTLTIAALAGLTNPMTTLGDTIYGGAAGVPTRLAGQTAATKQYLSQTGTGSASAAPVWAQIAAADLSNGVTGSGAVVLATSPALLTSPTAPTQAVTDNSTRLATTAYVTTAIANAIAAVNPAVAVQAASAAKLPNSPTYLNGVGGIGATITAGVTNTTLVVDGYTPALNDRILVKNEGDAGGLGASRNGVYVVSQLAALGLAWVLTRALDYDQPSDINNTGAVPVVSGTVNTQTSWLLTSLITTVGTDALTYVQFTVNPSTVVTGSGTTGKIPKWTTGASGILGDSIVQESSGQIGIGGAPNDVLDVKGIARITGGAGNPNYARFDNTANAGGKIWRFGDTGVVALGNFSIYDQTDNVGAIAFGTTGRVILFANIATVGMGVPAIYASGRVTAQTATGVTIATYTTPAADGTYLVSANALITAWTSGSLGITLTWTDESNAVHSAFQMIGQVSGAGVILGSPFHIRVKASTTITIATNGTGPFSMTYNAEGYITQIG